MQERPNRNAYYCDIAATIAKRSSCLTKHWGAVIVKNDTIVSTGYNGAPRGVKDCYELNYCPLTEYRLRKHLGRGEGYEHCLSVHAEMNAIIQASKEELENSTLYLCGMEINDFDNVWIYVENPKPCVNCRKAIINAKIKNVIIEIGSNKFITYDVNNWKNEESITGGY